MTLKSLATKEQSHVVPWKAQERKYLISLAKIDADNSNAIKVSWIVSIMLNPG